jgi:type IV pilus assembly protein PilM
MLQLGGSQRDLRAVEGAKFVIPAEVQSDPKRRREFIIEGVRRSVKEGRFRGRAAVMALSPQELAIRNIRMPKMPDDELAAAVKWEAQNKFPFDTATAVIQHVRAGEVHQGNQTLDEIILLAVPRADVASRIQMATEAGLDLVSLDAQPAAVFRGFERYLGRREDEGVVNAYADIGAGTTLVICRGRDLVFVKTIPIGGAVFNRAVAECLELAPAEAEALRRRAGRPPRGEHAEGEASDGVSRAVADALRPHLEDLANEIGLCLRYYAVTFRGARPEAITFVGGEAHDPSIPAGLARRLGLEARIGDPLRSVRTDHLGHALDRRSVRAEWATAFGLSVKGFHLEAQFTLGFAA